MIPLLLVFMCVCECKGRKRSKGNKYRESSEYGRPRLKIPKRSRYELFHELGKHLAPYDYSYLKEVSSRDKKIAEQALKEMKPDLARALRHYKVAGRERGDYEFDRYASDLIRAIRRQISIPEARTTLLLGLVKGLTSSS